MKKNIIMILAAAMFLFSSCATTGEGAYNGAYFGSILGHAIGGISGGHRGSHVGTVVGTLAGAAVGAAAGHANEVQRESDMRQYRQEKARLAANRRARENAKRGDEVYQSYGSGNTQSSSNTRSYQQQGTEDSGFNANNNSDDRIELEL